MKLGIAVQIVRVVNDLAETQPFYEKLGFHKLKESSKSNKWVLFTDSKINLLLEEGDVRYTGLNYFNPNFAEILSEMEEQGIQLVSKTPKTENLPESATFLDPEGFKFNIVNYIDEISTKADLQRKSLVDIGKFGELSHSVKDIDSKINFWTKLGYEVFVKETDPYPWAVLVDGKMILGLHQDEWGPGNTETTLTYFDPKMEEIIPKLQEKGIVMEQFQDFSIESGNAIARAPDGLQIFLFQGDV